MYFFIGLFLLDIERVFLPEFQQATTSISYEAKGDSESFWRESSFILIPRNFKKSINILHKNEFLSFIYTS